MSAGVTVNGEFVDDSVIREEMAMLRPHYEAAMGEMEPVAREMQLRDWSRENVIERTLLRQEAMKNTTPLPEEEVAQRMTQLLPPPGEEEGCEAGAVRAGTEPEKVRAEVVAQMRLEQLVSSIGARIPKPRKTQVQEYYNRHPERFATPAMYHASHIVKNVNQFVTEEQAREALEVAAKQLAEGKPFAEVADACSDCAGQGGSLGWFPEGEMVEEFEAALNQLGEGETSPLFRTQFGWHIAQLHGRRPSGVRPLAEVREEIEDVLWREQRDRALEEFVDALKAKAEIANVKRRSE